MRTKQALTPEKYPVLYAAEQRRKKHDEDVKQALKAHIELLTPEEMIIVYQLVRHLVRNGPN